MFKVRDFLKVALVKKLYLVKESSYGEAQQLIGKLKNNGILN